MPKQSRLTNWRKSFPKNKRVLFGLVKAARFSAMRRAIRKMKSGTKLDFHALNSIYRESQSHYYHQISRIAATHSVRKNMVLGKYKPQIYAAFEQFNKRMDARKNREDANEIGERLKSDLEKIDSLNAQSVWMDFLTTLNEMMQQKQAIDFQKLFLRANKLKSE